jgi:predicted LPLAT superfamily acyltransferase
VDVTGRVADSTRIEAGGWRETPERGSPVLLAVFARLCLALGRPFGRLVVLACSLYYFVAAPTARRHARAYLRRVLGRRPGPVARFRQLFAFASTILDRFYLMRGRHDLFEVTIEGDELMRGVLARGAGAFLMGAHLGSFEAVSSMGRRLKLPVAMAMYEANARKMARTLRAINPGLALEVIPVGTPASMLGVRDALDQGRFVGILADRTVAEQPAQTVSFLGEPALFPLGPMRMAALLSRPVIFMAGLYLGGNRYHVVLEEIADFSNVTRSGREAAVRAGVVAYAAALERHCREHPYNWFNFYDFWRGAPGSSQGASLSHADDGDS